MMDGETLSLVIKQAIKAQILELRVSMPGRVEKYDKLTQKADVKPLLMDKLKKDQSLIEFPVIPNVAVYHPQGGGAYIHMPVAKGDTGWLVFADKSIDEWLSGDGRIVDPKDTRYHNLSDAVFYPGINPFAKGIAGTDDSIKINFGTTSMELFDNGKIKIYNSGEELVSLLVDLCQALLDARTNTSLGPQPLVPPTLFSDLKTKLGTFKV